MSRQLPNLSRILRRTCQAGLPRTINWCICQHRRAAYSIACFQQEPIMSLASGPGGGATDSTNSTIEPVVLSLDERRGPVVAAAKERLLSSFRPQSRDPSPVRPEQPAAPAPAMPNFEAWHGPPAGSAAVQTNVAQPAGLVGPGPVPPPSGVGGGVPSTMMLQQPATGVPPPPPPSRTVVLETAPAAMGVPAPPTPAPAMPTPPAPAPADYMTAPQTQTRMPPMAPPLRSQPESFTVPEARTQAPVGIDDQSDAQLEQGLASSKMNDFMGAGGDATLRPREAMPTPGRVGGGTASKVPQELVVADEEDGGVMRSHSSFTFDTPPTAPAPATSEEVAPLLGSSNAPKSAPEINSYPLEPANTGSSDIPPHVTAATGDAVVTPPFTSGGNGGVEAAREGYVLLGSDSAPAAGADVMDSAVPPQESMNTAGRAPPAIEPVPVGDSSTAQEEEADSAIKQTREAAGSVASRAQETAQDTAQSAKETAGSLASRAQETAQSAAQSAKDTAVAAAQRIQENVAWAAESAKETAEVVAQRTKEAAVGAGEMAQQAAQRTKENVAAAAETAKPYAETAAQRTKENVAAAAEAAKPYAEAAAQRTKENVVAAAEAAKPYAEAAAQRTKENVAAAAEAAKPHVMSAAQRTKEAAGDMAKQAATGAGQMAQQAAAGASDMAQQAAAKAQEAMAKTSDQAEAKTGAEVEGADIPADETTAIVVAPPLAVVPVSVPTTTPADGHPLPPAFAPDTQAAGIAADEPTAVEAAPVGASALAHTEPMAATPALDLGQEPAVETDVADNMGMRAGAKPVKGGPNIPEVGQVEQMDAPGSGVASGHGTSSHITASPSDEMALLKKRTHETAVAYRDQALNVTHNKLNLRQGSALGTSTAIVLRGLATLAAYLKVVLVALVLGLLRGIWFLAVQTTRFTGSADAAAPVDVAPDNMVAAKVYKASKVTADAVADAAEATANAAKLNEE